MAHPRIFVVCALALAALAPSVRAQSAPPEPAQPEARPMPPPPAPRTIQTIYLKNVTYPNDLNDIQTAARNMLPQTRIYADLSQKALTVSATADEMQQVLKLIADLDQPRRVYRLTYTLAEMDGDRRIGERQFVFLAAAGPRSVFKQGSRVPIVTGTSSDDKSDLNSQVQYVDVGLTIEATVGGSADNLTLQTKIEQTSLSDEKPATSIPDPEIHQTVLDVSSLLTQGKPLVLGSLDLPGTSHRQQVEVTAEPVR
jgi:type II secretory pathway component GspD/PulD (secretin)